jgi:energy-coupling factor transporter ATP-binding protein EcfA2
LVPASLESAWGELIDSTATATKEINLKVFMGSTYIFYGGRGLLAGKQDYLDNFTMKAFPSC